MEILNYDLVCIGSGVAGMMASIVASNTDAKVCLVSKEPLGWGNTRISGGIISTIGSDKHTLSSDMIKSGKNLNQTHLLEKLLDNSVGVHELIESWGHLFVSDHNMSDQRKKIKPAGHSEARTMLSYQRGLLLANTLRSKLLDTNIHIFEEVIACKIILNENKVHGVLLYDWIKGKWKALLTQRVILASGGGGMLYFPHTDNMRSATGDGYAIGLNAGAHLIDMEQIQFMPFGITYPKGMLGIELGDTSAAGPYGVLRNNKGEIICSDLSNKTREEVSKTIALEIMKGHPTPNGGVWLDPTANRNYQDGEESWENWKTIGSLDPLKLANGTKAYQWKECFEVLPTQHYIMGGLLIDNKGNTSVDGLMAVGETAGGIHGAGRMGSMSLFDGLVFGKIVGNEVAGKYESIKKLSKDYLEEEKDNFINHVANQHGEQNTIKLKRELGHVMWKYAGIIRSQEMLVDGMDLLTKIEKKSHFLSVNWNKSINYQALEAIELRFMIQTAKSILLSALERKESRGSHYREDYPAMKDSEPLKNIVIHLKNGNLFTLLKGNSNE